MLTAMLGRKLRGRRRGVDVRSGSVREARLEAGLTLAQLGGDVVSRTAIHLVETGRSRPSMETLEQIARMTQKSIDFFLADPAALAIAGRHKVSLRELERLVLIRDLQMAVEAGAALLEEALSPDDAALAHFFVGQACCRLTRPEEAIEHLSQAREWFELVGDGWMAVETLDWESSAFGLIQDPRALPLALEALDRCRGLNPRPGNTEVRILGHIAGMHTKARSWTQAIRHYEAAVRAASGVKDLLQLGKVHHGLGIAYQGIQQPIRARQHFDKALALYSLESDLTDVYRVENDLADLLLSQGMLDSAEQHLHAALNGSSELQIDPQGRGYILANLGQVCTRQGRLNEARQYLAEALEAGRATGEQIVIATAHVFFGQLETKLGDARLSDEHFNEAIAILDQLEMPERLRDCHMDYAEALYARGEVASAAMHWKAAAEIARFPALGLAARGETFVGSHAR